MFETIQLESNDVENNIKKEDIIEINNKINIIEMKLNVIANAIDIITKHIDKTNHELNNTNKFVYAICCICIILFIIIYMKVYKS